MKLYRLNNPIDNNFAEAGRRGRWYPEVSPGVCSECGASRQKRIPPLIIEWLRGSDQIGNFVWVGGIEIIVTHDVRDALEERFKGFEFKPVKMWQDPGLKPPQRITQRTKPRVWLPYTGPTLSNLWITTQVPVDPKNSSIGLVRQCSKCGHTDYEIEGIEIRKSRWNPAKKVLEKIHIPREQGKGLYVNYETLQGADIFGLVEVPTWVFCTEPVKIFIEQRKFTNVSFLEVGDIFS